MLKSLMKSALDPLTPSVFHEAWWLNTVSGGRYEEVTTKAGGRIVGRLPYVVHRSSLGRTACGLPSMTHFLGPAVDEGQGAPCNRALKRDQIIRELLSQLPKTSGFEQRMHGGVDNVIIFQEFGFNTSARFTYEISPAPEDCLWSQMRDKTRNVIRQAEKHLSITALTDVEEFASAYVTNLRAVGIRSHLSADAIASMCAEAIARDRGRVLTAKGSNDQLLAAIFYVWDAKAAYYLLTTRAKDAGNGAVSLLIWQAIKDAAARGLSFDFDGVATHGSRLFFTGFGGKTAPRYTAYHFSLTHRLKDKVSEIFSKSSRKKYF